MSVSAHRQYLSYPHELKFWLDLSYLSVRERGSTFMLQWLLDSLFGCSHRKTTFPLTPSRKNAGFQTPGAARGGTYVTCLDCGKELDYNWEEMRIGKPVGERALAAEAQPSYR
jgi:hypothetical protein